MEKLNYKRVVVGQLQTNCYIVFVYKSDKAIIIDPGDDGDYISRILADEHLKPSKIIATHGHFDHIMAARELQLGYDIPFLVHKKDEFLVRDIRKRTTYFLGIDSGPPPRINVYLEEADKVRLGKFVFEVMETSGHTPGSIALYEQKQGLLFCGDTIFADGGVGRAEFSYSSETELKKSLARILSLPEKTRLLSGHGKPTTVGRELKLHRS